MSPPAKLARRSGRMKRDHVMMMQMMEHMWTALTDFDPGGPRRAAAPGRHALWGNGTGSDVMQRIAAPMVGGMVTSTVLPPLVIPVLYYRWRHRAIRRSVQTVVST